ncbi:MAG TPA: PadR family transcriptional regulator [Myxococcota bacterium]
MARRSERVDRDGSAWPAPESLPHLSGKERLILDLLSEGGEQYGLQLVQAANGRLKRGTVYVTLSRMEEKDLVTSHLEASDEKRPGLPRRLYAPTARGLLTLRALQAAEAVLLAPEFQT